MRNTKKWLVLLLTVAMLVNVLGVTAMAEESWAPLDVEFHPVEGGIVRVDILATEGQVVGDGKLVVTYDPAVLTYTGSSSTLLTAEKVENGTITLASANGRELAADSALASLTFTANAAYYDTEIVIETLQRGAADVTGETSTVSVSKAAEVIAYGTAVKFR